MKITVVLLETANLCKVVKDQLGRDEMTKQINMLQVR